MSAVILDGKALALKKREEIKQQIDCLKSKGLCPGLAVILVGEDPASKVYVNNKKKACEQTGIYSEVHLLPENTSEADLLTLIDRLNKQENIHGILLQSIIVSLILSAALFVGTNWVLKKKLNLG